MAIIHNGKNVIGRYHGSTEILAKYHGSNLVWQKNRLPVEYREVEYIESTGSQYIDTGYIRTGNINKVEIKYNYLSTNTTNGCTLYGYSKSLVRTPYITNFNETNTSKLAIYGSNGKWLSFTSARDTVHTSIIETNNQNKTWKFTHDNQELTNGSFPNGSTTLCGVSSALFAVKNPTDEKPNSVTEFSKSRIYYYKEYDNDTLVRNFIPCVRVDDRKAGMYDTVTKTFYPSATSTNFKHGAYKDTFERICTELEYIESTGSQYIDTEINATNELKLYSKVSTRSSAELLVFGASANETRLGIVSAKGIEPIGNIVFQYGKQNIVTNVVTPKNTIIELTLDGNSLYKDGELIYKGTKETFDVGRNLYMFATNSTALARYGIIKLYKAYIEKNGVLLRNFIPCKYKGTGKIGMYDTVSGDIFVSETSTEFIAGNNSINSQYDSSIYEESDGSKWIRIMHHQGNSGSVNGIKSFTTSLSSNDWKSGLKEDSSHWFDMYNPCNARQNKNSWEFIISESYMDESLSASNVVLGSWKAKIFRFVQTVNPFDASFNDVTAAKVTYKTGSSKLNSNASSYSSCTLGGLYKSTSNKTYLCQNDGNSSNSNGAIGCVSLTNNAVPGWKSSSSESLKIGGSSGFIDVYIRIDDMGA